MPTTQTTPTPTRRPVPAPAGHLTIRGGGDVGTIPATARLLDHVRRLAPGTHVVFIWHSAAKSTSGRHVPFVVGGHAWPDAVVVERLEVATLELATQVAGIAPTITAPLADLAYDGMIGADLDDLDEPGADGTAADEASVDDTL